MYTLSDIKAFCVARGKYKIILDTNLLLLLLVGACDKEFIPQHKCTEKYSVNDYELLVYILRFFKTEIVITPYILAEVSDLSRKDINEPRLSFYLARVIERLRSYKEEHIPLEKLLESGLKLLALYGFPDISIVEAAKSLGAAVITDDYLLSAFSIDSLVPTVNFSALRSAKLMVPEV